MKLASNLVVSTKDQFGTKSVCNKHYIKDLHRHIGTFTIRECEYCKKNIPITLKMIGNK